MVRIRKPTTQRLLEHGHLYGHSKSISFSSQKQKKKREKHLFPLRCVPGRRRQPPVLQDRLGGTHLTVTQPVTWTHAAARTATRHVCRPPAPRARSRAPVASSSSRVKKRKKRGKIEEKKGKKNLQPRSA